MQCHQSNATGPAEDGREGGECVAGGVLVRAPAGKGLGDALLGKLVDGGAAELWQ